MKKRIYTAMHGEHLAEQRQMAFVSGQSIGKNLEHFQKQIGAPLAFQIVVEANYVGADCFVAPRGPMVVPAKTLLSQLL